MVNLNEMIMTAQLNNNKKVVLEPVYAESKLNFRYMTEQEIKSGQLDLISNHVWLQKQIFNTVEDGVSILFADIEGNAIVLMRL